MAASPDCRRNQHDQCFGNRRNSTQAEQQGEGSKPDSYADAVPLRIGVRYSEEQMEEVRSRNRHANDHRDLAQDDGDRKPDGEAMQDRSGNEARQSAESGDACDQEEHSDQSHHQGGHCSPGTGIAWQESERSAQYCRR